jgi:carbamoyl-phosphate synthase large subunit
MKSINIAVTGLNATNNPAPGLNIIRSLKGGHLPHARIIGLTYDLLSTGAYEGSLLDEVYMVPYPAEGEAPLLSRLVEINKLAQLDVLLPCLDSEVILYASLKARLEHLGINMLLPDRAKVQLRSKQALPDFCKKNNFNTPLTKIVYDFNDIQHDKTVGYPSVLKGTFTDARRVDSLEESNVFFNRLAREWGLPLIWQQFIQGEEYNVVALTDEDSRLVGKVLMKKFALTEKGKAWAGVTIGDKAVLELADEIIRALNWVGPLELEMIKETSSGKFYILEINPRFPTWVYLAVGAGQNLPLAAVKLALGKKIKPFHTYELGKLFVRSMREHICSFDALGNLTVRGNVLYHNHRNNHGNNHRKRA